MSVHGHIGKLFEADRKQYIYLARPENLPGCFACGNLARAG